MIGEVKHDPELLAFALAVEEWAFGEEDRLYPLVENGKRLWTRKA